MGIFGVKKENFSSGGRKKIIIGGGGSRSEDHAAGLGWDKEGGWGQEKKVTTLEVGK